jgi:parallel beta-helix repeat protein
VKNKNIKISLVLVLLSISIIFPVIAVSVKKQPWTSGPVYINDAVSGFSWMDWSLQPWLKGSGTEEDPYIIRDLVIEVSGSFFGMMIENSDVHFKIMHCTIRNSGIEGERTAGLLLVGTTNGVVFKNTFTGNMAGIALIGTQYNLVQKNLCSENEVGIYLQWSMFDTIKQNDCKNNLGSGIMLSTAHKTIIEKNECMGNGLAGILLINEQADDPEGEHDPKDNILYKNKVMENEMGIYLSNADLNDLFQNTILDNNYGILLDSGCEDNLVYHNNFIDNGVQAADYQPGKNNWYHIYMLEGNFWSNYIGTDDNEDGVGDTPFGYDEYPLMEKNSWEYLTAIEEEILDVHRLGFDANRLGGGRTVNSSETSYLIVALGQAFSEMIEASWDPPYTVHVNFYGVYDVEFQGTFWYFDEEEFYTEPVLWQFFYVIIPPHQLLELGLLPNIWHNYQWQITFYEGGEQQTWDLTSYFYLI